MLQKQSRKQYSTGEGTKWWKSLFDNLGGVLSGTAKIVEAANNKNININEHHTSETINSNRNNNVLYIIIGLIAAVGVIAFVRK